MLGASAGSLVAFSKYRGIICQLRNTLECSPVNAPEKIDPKRFCGLKALIVTGDAEMGRIFSHLFWEIQVETQQCASEAEAIGELLSQKFEALVLDMDELSGCAQIVQNLQRTRPNQNVVVFAVASDARAKSNASVLSNPIIIERPFVPSEIRDLIKTLHGRMLRDRLAYFRLALDLPVSIRRESGILLQCTMLNLSQSGMAVSTPSAFHNGEKLNIVFVIPNSSVFVCGDGTVIWDDNHGKAGILFRCTSSSVQERLFEWLHDQFFMHVETGTEAETPKELAAGV
ncbi:MAG: type pilus assembly PilZ [Acidobacteriaceae bacterium]|jgi:hypothetical protein|nr:type pilus assembly PilZ [Acidobacteriaceae bacterium]